MALARSLRPLDPSDGFARWTIRSSVTLTILDELEQPRGVLERPPDGRRRLRPIPIRVNNGRRTIADDLGVWAHVDVSPTIRPSRIFANAERAPHMRRRRWRSACKLRPDDTRPARHALGL